MLQIIGMRKTVFYFLATIISLSSVAQNLQRPKLVVGIVLDQMRWDYLYRYYDRYGSGGFKRLLTEGFSCANTFIPYTPTVTAAGHSCIYTGSVPALHGIMGNNWYDKDQHKTVYCTDDNSVQSVGTTSDAGKMSPKNLWSSTIGDELRLATNFTGKTISIALKDRASILPGGHSSNGSFWFDNASGGWITSSFYMNELPSWIKKINDQKLPDAYLKQNWTTLYPINTYTQSTADSTAYEGKLGTEDFTFPHNTAAITVNRYEAFRTTPSGNSFTFLTAKAAIAAEQLGQRNVTDLLAVSFSSTDHIGHTFGPNSIEVEDAYLRFDKDLSDFLLYLDKTIGKGQYLVFLTSDHGVANNPYFLADKKLPAGNVNFSGLTRRLNDSLEKNFGVKKLILQSSNYQIFLNDTLVKANALDRKALKQFMIDWLIRQPGIAYAVDLSTIQSAALPERLKMMVSNGYNPKLSGDVQVMYRPQWFENWQTGTTHGLWNPYDSHIPLVWFGWHVKHGELNREVYMTDIAPTLAALLHIQMPSACIGKVIEEVTK
jgi:predicted AlkP superfamily pyrophosphatase or phosphodiesterase